MNTNSSSLLVPGRNCWCRCHADRLSVLIDGADYFRALRDAVMQARHSIYILGWDIDTRLRLVREDTGDGAPDQLGELLHHVLKHNRHLQVYVLIWDWAMLYAAERQWLPLYNIQWRKHRRLHFRLDNQCPFGASQHQKLVVIDDRLAFIGGFDLSKDRWDTSAHRPDDPRRVNTEGKPYRPFHDLQAAVSGEAAATLGALFRERWALVTGKPPKAVPGDTAAPWPEGVDADVRDVEVALARTAPAYGEQPAHREIETLLRDAIAAAQQAVYIENEYLTSESVGTAMVEAMRAPDGPELVVVLPEKTGNWLEQNTMDVLRWRLLQRLREADRHDRLRVYYPEHQGLGDEYISLHAKLLIADDRLLTLGSANLSNRSMGFDTECNLILEAGDAATGEFIRGVRNRLLAEHLDLQPDAVAESSKDTPSLIEFIESRRGNRRSLEPLDGKVDEVADALLPRQRFVDPERPVSAGEMAELMFPGEAPRSGWRQRAPALIGVLGLMALAAAWRWTPLSQWLDGDVLQGLMSDIGTSPLALLIVPAAYVAAGLLSIPLILLVVATALVFGPWAGFLYAMTGALLSAVVNFGLGRWLASGWVRRLAGTRLNRISERLAQRGILAIALLRLVPVAPFGVVNLVAGATQVRLRDFVLGSLIGLAPGLAGVTLFSHQVMATFRQPDAGTLALLAAIAGALALGGWAVSRWARTRAASTGSVTSPASSS